MEVGVLHMHELICRIRLAIEEAHENGEFNSIVWFRDFPRGCCGIASDLVGHYLLEYGIESEYVCGNYAKGDWDNCQSHACVRLKDGTIIDITGDQFRFNKVFLNYDKPVYVGPMDEFHMLFEEDFVHRSARIEDFDGVGADSLAQIYMILEKYL